MLGANAFWDPLWIILDQAAGSEQELRSILASQSRVVIVTFDREFRRAADNLRRIEVDGLSEDELKDLYAQVVSKGKTFYDFIVRHPERILEDTKPEDPCFFGTAGVVLLELFGEEAD